MGSFPKKIKAPKVKKTNNANFFNSIKGKGAGNIAAMVTVVLMHALFIAAVVLSYRYFAIYPSLITSLLGIAVCVIVMCDVVFVIGFRYKDLVMKIISVVLSCLILVVSTVGTYYLNKVNTAVGNVIGTNTSNVSKYEEISGVFVINNKNADKITDLNSMSGKVVGYVTETEKGAATIGLDLLDTNKVNYTAHVYNSYDELIIDLSDDNIDVAIFLNGYRGLYARNAEEGNADYTGIIADFIDVYEYSEEVEIAASDSKKDISKDPFNVLLIGYSRTDIGSPIGLADAIIVASVNPKTYTVSMMSIARDSYVPISCYGGTKDKINSARGTSRACFIQTVEDYTGMKMDFYMEADYEAVVDVVDAIEGIVIDNPVDFTLDGVFVPAGTYTAWGWQVLEFCRERHHMPNGDFDRQQHQKEVIIAIAEKLLKKADISLFLNAIEAAGDKFSTNLTLNQLTNMFNMLLSTKNYTGLKVSKLIDFHQLRLTGYSDWYYNYSMSLPLWIYKIYQGSYDESIKHAKFVLDEVDESSNQKYVFTYDKNAGYDRPLFFSLNYNEEEVHEVIPPYYPNFVGYSYADVLNMASEKGYNLNFSFISSDSSAYDESRDGYVVSQSLRYGTLCSVGSNTLTVMGDGKVKIKFPEFGDWTVEDAKNWCKDKGYDYSTRELFTNDLDKKNKVADMEQDGKSVIISYYSYVNCENIDANGACQIKVENYVGKKLTASESKTTANITITYVPVVSDTTNDPSKANVAYEQSVAAGTLVSSNTTVNVKVYNYICSHPNTEAIADVAASATSHGQTGGTKCKVCGAIVTQPTIVHNPVAMEDVAATCEEDGHTGGTKCSVCGEKLSDYTVIPKLGHSYGSYTHKTDSTCDTDGTESATCSVCGHEDVRTDQNDLATGCAIEENGESGTEGGPEGQGGGTTE